MSEWFWKKITDASAWIATIAFFAFMVFSANIEIKDLDLWLHLAVGRYISTYGFVPFSDFLSCTIAGKPWINHEWLFQIIVFNIFDRFGADGLHALQAVVVGMTFVMLFALGYRRQFHVLQLLILLVVLSVFQLRLTLRPEIFSLLFFIFYIFTLTFHFMGRFVPLALFVVQVLWVNIHGFFILGPLLLLVVGVGDILKKFLKLLKFSGEWGIVSRLTVEENRQLLKIGVFVILACFFNPNFVEGALYPLKVMFSLGESKVFFEQIVELQRPISLHNIFSINEYLDLKVLILISFLSFAFNFKKLDLTLFVLWVLMLCFALGAVRNVVYFSFVAYLCIMANLNSEFWKEYLNVFLKKKWIGIVLILSCSAGIVLWIGQRLENLSLAGYYDFSSHERKSEYGGISLRSFPFKAVDFLKDNHIKGNFYNDFNSGAYLLGRLSPDVKVFIDGRTEMYGEEFFNRYTRIQSGDKRVFDEAVEKYDLTAAFVNSTKVHVPPKLFKALYDDPHWKLVYFDYDAAIFLRDINFNRDWIRRYEINLSQWVAPQADLLAIGPMTITPYQHIHRAYALYYAGLKDKALSEVEEALKISPNYDEAYYLKGRILYDNDDFLGALEYFRKAKVLKPSDIETRFGLARAFYRLGDWVHAQEQADKILSVNPRDINALFLLTLIYAKQKLYADAYALALEIHAMDKGQLEPLVELADILADEQQAVFAKKLYELVLSVDGAHSEAKQKMLRLP